MHFSFCTLHSNIEVTADTVFCVLRFAVHLYRQAKQGFVSLDQSCVSCDTWKPVHLFSLCVFVHTGLACLPAITKIQFSVIQPMVMSAASNILLFPTMLMLHMVYVMTQFACIVELFHASDGFSFCYVFLQIELI